MSFSQRLKIIENLMTEDTERCLLLISQRIFVQSLFYQELKALVNIFEGYLQKKVTLSKAVNDGKAIMRDQLILGFYSIIIMRSSVISMRHQQISTIATKADQYAENIFNSKLAVENLLKIYKKLEEGDLARQIIAGLLLQIKGFNNYKLIVKDLSPRFVSEQTFQTHFQNIKSQCPNLLEIQLNKYKVKWSKYLRFKPLSLQLLVKLLQQATQLQSSQSVQKWDEWRKELQSQSAYIITRLSLLNSGQMIQRLNIDEIVKNIDDLNAKLTERLKQTAIITKKAAKTDILTNQYDLKQFIHKNYLSFYLSFLKIINKMISSIGKNWFRKIKWLYNLVNNIFINFNIKSSQFHESIAQQYSKILITLVKIVTNFLVTFGVGLFSSESLNNLAFNQEYSISKLIEALLYNQYPFEQAQVIQFQNYQKQRKNHENKNKQSVIDMVNFNMKSLNINLHWDTFFIKIIPNLKNSVGFAQEIIYSSLYFIFKYFELTHNFQPAAKFLLMLSNAKNSIFSSEKKNRKLIEEIKASVYPHKKDVKQGIQYFCEEYFAQYLKINQKRVQEEQKRKSKVSTFSICKNNEIKLNKNVSLGIKKTESREAILEGWENFQAAKQSKVLETQPNKQQNYEMVNSQMFYSIKDSVNDKEGKDLEKGNSGKEMQQQNQILLPQF